MGNKKDKKQGNTNKFVCSLCSLVTNISFRSPKSKDSKQSPKTQTKQTPKKMSRCTYCFLVFTCLVVILGCVAAVLVYRQSLETKKPFMTVANQYVQLCKEFIAAKLPTAKKVPDQTDNAHQDM